MRTLGEVGAHMAYNTVLVGILIMYGLFGAFVFRKFEATERVSVSDGQPGISRDELLVDLWSGKDLDFDTWSVQAKINWIYTKKVLIRSRPFLPNGA